MHKIRRGTALFQRHAQSGQRRGHFNLPPQKN
jgi:hypothetical protein